MLNTVVHAKNTGILCVTFNGNSFNDSEFVTRIYTNGNDFNKRPAGMRDRLEAHEKKFKSLKCKITVNNVQIFRPYITVNTVALHSTDQRGNTPSYMYCLLWESTDTQGTTMYLEENEVWCMNTVF
jgi:hypothetical protein